MSGSRAVQPDTRAFLGGGETALGERGILGREQSSLDRQGTFFRTGEQELSMACHLLKERSIDLKVKGKLSIPRFTHTHLSFPFLENPIGQDRLGWGVSETPLEWDLRSSASPESGNIFSWRTPGDVEAQKAGTLVNLGASTLQTKMWVLRKKLQSLGLVYFFSLAPQPFDDFLKTNALGKAIGLEKNLTFWLCLFVFTVMFMVSSLSNFLLVSP